ncbi:phosphoribosyl-AMP cyclohydrolase [bacterium]|nr:phosphoribosyl-AMP cyclohydrolase [bacterium]
MKMDWLKDVKFDANGLVPAIVQDEKTGEVLMVAYMNEESLKKTVEEKIACFYSRSRQKLWVKGETSGNFLKVKEIWLDCDGDAILLKVEAPPAVCHTGYRSCFHRILRGDKFEVEGIKVFSPEEVYGKEK